MKINCLSCGHNVDIGNDYDDYEGQIKCYACGAILEIKTEDAKVKSVNYLKTARPSVEEGIGSIK